jgi:hypothetical protein
MTGTVFEHKELHGMNKLLVLAGALALAGLSTSAMAQGGFVRVEAGRSHTSVDVDGLGSDSDNDTAWSLRGGYYFNDNVAVEGFYTRAYDKTFSDGVDTVGAKADAIGLGVVGKKNFGADNLGFFIDGRAGITRGKIKLSLNGESDSDTSTKLYYGVGAGYDFTKALGLSLNIDRLHGAGDGVDVKSNLVTLGAEFRF